MESIKHRLIAGVLLCAFGLASVPARAEELADDQINSRPSAMAMFGDVVLARPALFAATVIGTGLFVVSLPFTVMGGNVKESAKTLIAGPAKATFVRCLGCTSIQDEWKNKQEAANDTDSSSANK
jgi:hypothetical protein